MLRTLDPHRRAVLTTDASGIAGAAILTQPDDEGRQHPVAYESRKLTAAERNNPAHVLELLAVVHALRAFKHYLLGIDEMEDFRFDVTHLPGSRNPADPLTRRGFADGPGPAASTGGPESLIRKASKSCFLVWDATHHPRRRSPSFVLGNSPGRRGDVCLC